MFSVSTGGSGTSPSGLPASFFGGTSASPAIYACANSGYASVQPVTVTRGTIPASSTVTSVQQINNVNPGQLSYWFIPLMFMLLGVAGTTAIGGGYAKAQNQSLDQSVLPFLVVLGLTPRLMGRHACEHHSSRPEPPVLGGDGHNALEAIAHGFPP